MITEVTLVFGGREYTSKRKPYGQHLKARKRIKESSIMRVLESLDGFVAELRSISDSVPDGGSWQDIDFGKALSIVPILPMMVNGLVNSVEEVAELIFEYEPKLKAERKWIEANAYDEEIIAAFMEILKLLFPIFALWDMVSGRGAQETSTNSHSQNGVSSTLPASGPKKKSTTSPGTTPI